MANSDKDIRIVPNRNKSGLPNIAFTGYNNDPIVLNVLDDNTISFEGSSGQLFSVSNAVTTGTIFSVNDISGIPSFRIDADGTVGIAEFSGNVGIGLQSPQSKLSVGGDINVGAGYTFRVAGTKVLDSFSLGTGVTQSSLTSLGTITSGTWQGTAIGVNYGGTGATNASDARSFLGAATAGTNSDLIRLLGVQHLFVTIPTATAIGITVKAATSQASNMMEFVNSSNTVMSWITKDGTFSHGAYFTHSDGRVPGFSVQRSNAAGIVARGFNSDAFPAIEVQNNPGSLTVGLYPSGLVYGGVLQAYASTASTNTTTGALIVAGGAAIAGTTNFGRDVRIFSSLASSSPFTGSLVVSGGVGISNNLFVGGGVAFTASIASTSTATGTLVVTGGVGIGGSVFTSTSNASSISGVVLSNGSVTLTGTYTQSNSSTTAFSVKDGSNTTAFNIDTIGDVISLPVAVASTSTNSGSLVVAGGVGIGGTANIKSAYVYNDLLHIPGTGNTFGMSFTSFTLPTGFTGSGLYAIYAENRFVATGGSVVAYSDDLINWTTSYIPWNASVYNQSITYGNGVYVVTSSVNSYVAYSRDLLTWTLASVQYQNYQTAAYGNGRFVINAGSVVGISTNGANWSSLSPTGSAPNYQALKFQNGYFYSSSSRSVDGIAWEPLNISISVGNISYGNGLYFGAQYNSSNYAYSYDGVNFTTTTIANNVYVGTDYHNGVYYLRTQHNNAILYYSTDGLNYQGLGFGGVGQFAMAFGKNKIVVFGRDGASGVYGYYAEGTNGKIDLNPIREGNIDNTVIGSRTPKPANFTDLSTTGYVNIVNRAGSASTTSGALVVRGGVGIGGSLYVASPAAISGVIINSGTITGSLTGTATTATYSHQSGYAITSGFATSSSTATLASSASTSYSVNVNSALTNSSHYLIFSPNASGSGIALSTESSLVYNPSTDILSASGLAVTSGTPTTSTTSGALVVTGGVGIGGSVFTSTSNASSISGVVLSNGSVSLTGTYTQSNSSTTAFSVKDGSNTTTFNIDTIGDVISLPVAVASTSTGTGSLVVAGGVGIGGSLYSGSILTAGRLQNQSFSGSSVGATDGRSNNYGVLSGHDRISFGNGVFVTNSSWGAYNSAYSTDGINWTTSSLPVNQGYPVSMYGNGYFVLVASGATNVLYSTNGSSWSQVSIGNTLSRSSGVYGNGKYVVVGFGETYNYSTNITTWTTGILPSTGSWTIAYGNGIFVALAYGTKKVIYSYDGIYWNIANTLTTYGANWTGITYANGRFITSSWSGGGSAYSLDGINWYQATGTGGENLNTAAYGNGVYFVSSTGSYYLSGDGTTYSNSTPWSVTYEAGNTAYGLGKFQAIGRWIDGPTNTVNLDPKFTGEINNVRIGAIKPASGDFTNLSSTGSANLVGTVNAYNLNIIAKVNQTPVLGGFAGTNGWTSSGLLAGSNSNYALAFGNGLFVQIRRSTDYTSYSPDGKQWVASNMPFSGSWIDVAWGKDKFVAISATGASGAYSGNGITWTSMNMPSNTSGWYAVTYGDEKFVAVGNGATVAYSSNGISWTGAAIADTNWTGIAYGNGTFVAVSGNGSSSAYSYDGLNWNYSTVGGVNNGIKFITYGNGYFVVTNYVSTTINYSRDGINWSSATRTSGASIHTDLAYGNGIYSIFNYFETSYSYDAVNWLNGNSITATDWQAVAYGNNRFVATSINTSQVGSIDGPSNTLNLYPKFTGDIDNVRIGAKEPAAAEFTNLAAQQPVRFTANTPTTSTTSGALVVVGGVGIGGSVNISGIVRSGQLIAPTFTLSALGGTGALTPSTTYYYKLSSLDYFGNESLPSNESSIALNSSTYAVTINPSIDQSIYAIKIYRTTTSNSYTNSLVDTYYPFRGGQNASYTPYNYYDRGKPTTSSSPATVPNANRAVLGSSTNSTMGKLNLTGQLLIQNKNTSAPSNNIGIQLGNYDIAAVRNGVLSYLSSITSATGGTLAAGTTYYYVYTGVDSYGNETFPSIEYAFTADSNGAAQMNFAGGDYGLLKYRFYRTTTPGNYTNSYIGELPSSIDLNYPTQNVSPPTSSSANAYVLKSVPAENIPSYIDSLDIRPGMSGAVRKLADNQYNTLSGIVTSGIAGTLAQNTIYYYKVASYDRYGNTSSASIPYLINTGPATSVQITPMGVDWPAGVEGFLVYRSTSKDNFTNVPTFYAYPGTAITDTGNYEFLSTAPTTNNYLLGNFGGYYYGYANFYMRSLDLAAGGNQSSFNILSGRSPQPTVSAATGGTLTPGDVYYYKVLAFGRGDDYSMASPAVRFVIGAGGAARISVNSIGITGFRHYNIYRTADLSNWTNSQIARYVSESDFVDIGYPGTSGSPVGHAGLKRGTTTTISDGAITTSTIRVNSFTQDIPAPQSISISGTTGGILTTGTTYYYRILPVGVGWYEYGQASKQVIYTTSSSENAISLSWGAVQNATGYRVMRSTTNNAGAGQTYTFVHGTSLVDKGYSTTTHPYDPYALYYPGSYGATFSANLGRYHLPFLNLTNGDSPNLYISLLPPTISSTSTGTGGTLANNTDYYYIIEAFDYNNGSSLPSTEVVVNTGANNAVTLNWNEKNGAFYYKIYRSSNSDFTNKQINQTVYGTTFTDINYPTVNTSPRYSSTNGSMFRLGSAHNAGVYYGLLSRSVFQATPTTQGAYGTDFSVRVAGRPAGSIYGALFELGDFASTGYNGTSYGTYFGLSSATGFTGNYIDFQSSSISRFKVDYLGNATIGSTTGSGSTSTGALVVTGGVGIGQSLFTSPSYSSSISGAIFSNGSATLSGSFTQNNSSTTAFQVRDGSNNPAFVIDTIGDIITLPVAVASTSTGTGSLVVAGGVGIGQSINIGGRVGIGTNLLDATLNIRTSTAATPGIVIQGSTSQSASLFRVNSSVGGSFFEITNSGIVNIKTSTAGDYNSVPLQRWYGDSNSIVGVMQKGGFFYTGNGLGYVDDFGTQTLVHQWVPASSYYITNWSQRMANGGSIQFASPAGGAIHVSGDTNGSLTFTSFGTYTNNTMVKLKDPNYGTNQALLGIVTQDGSYTRSQLFSYGNLALNMTVAGSAGTDWDTTNLFRANVNTKTRYLGNLAVLAVDDTNRFVVGPYGNTTVALGGTTVSTGFIIKAASSQTGNLFEAQSSTGATITFIDASGDLSIGASTASTSSTTGALIVSGGVGIGQTLNVAGNATIGGTLNVSGTNSYIQNNLYVGNANQGRLYFSQATLGSAGTTVIPSMAFIGATNSPITLSVLPDNSLSFDGSSGQLFSINNNLSTGWIFAINDISGLPIFRTNADLTVAMGEYGGNVGIGLSNPTFKLQVSGNAGISGTTLISNTTASTNTTSGALVVSGGVGIGGSLFLSSSVPSSLSGVVVNNGVVSSGSWAGNAITVNYGGTGYNSYTKGDILVGAGSTFIKLNVGTDNYVLTALSSAATGLTWSPTAATGITTLNGINTGLQYLSIGYSGSVPSFSSSGSTHTLNIPIAGTGSTGLVSTQSQSFAGIKTFTNAVSITDNTGSGTYTAGALTVTGGVGIGGTLNVQGDFNVQGTFTTINSTTLNVADKNIELGVVTSPSDLTAEGGGITLKGATDKLLNWYSGVGWSSSESFNLASTNTFKINNTTVLSSSSLGTGVTNSSLTALGTITTGTWSATTISPTYGGTGLAPTFTVGDLLYANTSSTWGRLSASSNSGYILSSAGSGATPTYVNPLSITVGLASTSNYSDQSGYGITSGLATTATYAHQSGYAITSGSSNTSGYATTSGLATTATYSHQSGYGITAGLATTATYAHQSGYAITSGSSSTSNFATSSGLATTATYAHQSGYAITSTSSGSATTATNVNVSAANTSSSHPVLFTPATGTASGAALSTETSFVYNPSTDILSVSGLAVTSTTPSTSFTSGALIVSGGAGIAGSIWANSIAIGATLSYAAPNLLSSFSSSVNSYSQVIIQNKSNGSSASADFVVNNNLSTDTTYYGNLGMNSSGFTGSGSLSLPNAVYLSSTTGDLVIGSTTANLIRFVYNSGATDTMQISGTGVSILSTTSSTSATTGALTISGGVGIGQSLYTSPSFASSISGVILNNGAITNTGTITSTGVMTISNSSTSAFAVRDASNNSDFNVDTIAGVVTVTSTTGSTNVSTGALVVRGGMGVSGDVFICGNANSKLNIMQSSGDEGGEIFLNKPVTNTTISNGVSIDIYQNRLRFFESGGSNRGYYIDITAGGNGVTTNLVGGGGGGSGTVTTLTAGTGISFSTGSTITTSGTIRARRPLVTSFCAGYTPAASGADTVVIRLPDSPSDGTTAITYEPQEFHVRVETASANTTTIQLEKYTGTGAFSGTAITSVSISGASTYEVQTSVFAGAGIFLTSGDKLRINFTALSASHANFSVYLELEEV